MVPRIARDFLTGFFQQQCLQDFAREVLARRIYLFFRDSFTWTEASCCLPVREPRLFSTSCGRGLSENFTLLSLPAQPHLPFNKRNVVLFADVYGVAGAS